MLVGPRIAEIGEHTVAHVFGDKPAAAPDHLGNAAVIGADDRAQILRIEPRRQRRRADQIAEHHRQLPPLGLGWCRRIAGCRRHGGGYRGAERGNGIEELAPVADRCNADVPEVVRSELPQYLPIDLVIAERLLVTLKTKTTQPRRYVHAVILGSEERQLLVDDDILLPSGLPAAALKWPQRLCLGFGQ